MSASSGENVLGWIGILIAIGFGVKWCVQLDEDNKAKQTREAAEWSAERERSLNRVIEPCRIAAQNSLAGQGKRLLDFRLAQIRPIVQTSSGHLGTMIVDVGQERYTLKCYLNQNYQVIELAFTDFVSTYNER